MKWLTNIKSTVTISAIVIAGAIIFQSCGVKGRPLPPLKPAPLSDPNNQKTDDKKR